MRVSLRRWEAQVMLPVLQPVQHSAGAVQCSAGAVQDRRATETIVTFVSLRFVGFDAGIALLRRNLHPSVHRRRYLSR